MSIFIFYSFKNFFLSVSKLHSNLNKLFLNFMTYSFCKIIFSRIFFNTTFFLYFFNSLSNRFTFNMNKLMINIKSHISSKSFTKLTSCYTTISKCSIRIIFISNLSTIINIWMFPIIILTKNLYYFLRIICCF